MRVLLDACVPRGLRDSLSNHDVRTAPEMGWGDLDNGDLLLLTVDKRLPQEHRVADRQFGVVVLRAKSNRLADLLPLVSQLHVVLSTLQAGEVREVVG